MNTSYTELSDSIAGYIERYLHTQRVKVQEFDDGWEEEALGCYVAEIDHKGQQFKIFAADYGDFVRIAMEHDKEEDHETHADEKTDVRVGDAIITHINMITG